MIKRKNAHLRKNKIVALALLVLGVLPILIDRDITVLILGALIAVPLLVAKSNWIVG